LKAGLLFIAAGARVAYLLELMPRILSVLLLALALFLSPLAMIGSAGVAEAAAQADAPAMHCEDYPPAKTHGKQDSGKGIACAVTCAAIPAVAEPLRGEPLPLPMLLVRASGEQRLTGVRPESETPPPRGA
jgi:hypothetical protein